MRKRNGFSQASIYNDLIKAADNPPPLVTRENNGKRKGKIVKPETHNVPISDTSRIAAVESVLSFYKRGWVTAKNAVIVIKDIVR